MKKALYVVFLFCLCWGAARLSHHKTAGFRLSKLEHNTAPSSIVIAEGDAEKACMLLDQTFTFLGRGLQSYSFVGEDGKTVLKLFNNRYQRRLFLWERVPAVYPFKLWRWKKCKTAKTKLHRTFESYKIAWEKLPEETGLYYLQIHPSGQIPRVKIIDKIGICHTLNLANYSFALQKKATLPYEFLSALKVEGKESEARDAIVSLVSLLRAKMELSIGDSDPLIRANCGFSGGAPLQIDIGPLYYNPELLSEAKQTETLKKQTLSLKHWLENHYPEMVQTLEKAL